MPRLVRLYIDSALIGLALAAGFTLLLVLCDIAGLRHLILSSPAGWLAALMLVVFNCILFASVQFAFVVMRLGRGEGGSGGRRQPRRTPALQPALVPVRPRK